MSEAEPRLLVLTNRLPFALQRAGGGLEAGTSAGGLASALDPVLRKLGGTWIGWPGIDLRRHERPALRGAPYPIRLVPLSETEIARYYHGLANRSLWPLFHSFPSRARFDRRDWSVYRRVNRRFADAALREMSEEDLVWIHDYHLMLAPQYLRRYISRARLAFFLHVPFPPFDVFRIAPWARELLRGVLACDLIGFHVSSYAHNFFDCVERLLGAEVDRARGLVRLGGRTTAVDAFPIGIDFAAFDARAREAPPARLPRRERILIGVDRLDYTKGIPERILAVERLFERRPELREKLVLLQIGVPSRGHVAEYRALRREIDELVGRVNGRFGSARWSPIRYLSQNLGHERLAGLYRDADVALVTPLRDGMNLVAKEFVASQVGDDPGVLVLSRMAGAAESMREAVFVNPYDVDQTAERIQRALAMERGERCERMRALRERERRADVYAWVAAFLAAAQARP
jgi:trehalose 6-phosphate synthase/phosphatase